MRQLKKKMKKVGMDRRTKRRFQQFEKRNNDTPVSSILQQQQTQYRLKQRVKQRTRKSAMTTTKQRELKTTAFASRYLNDAEKKYSVGELELLIVVWGLERFRFHLYGKQVQLFSDHQALELLLKKKNK